MYKHDSDRMHQALVEAEDTRLDGDDSTTQAEDKTKAVCPCMTTRRLGVRNLVITLSCTSFMLMLYGYDFGITAWSVLFLEDRGAEQMSDVYVYLAGHSEALGGLVACAPIGGVIGGLLGRKFCNWNGRKAEILVVNLFCIVGASLEGSSAIYDWDSWGYVGLYASGRVVYGIGLGLSLRCGPMYLRETVTATFRDAANVSVKLSIVMGMIVSYVIGGLISNVIYGYFGAIIAATVSLTCLYFMPESPMYMLLHADKFSQADVLDAMRFTNPAAADIDVQALENEILTEILANTPGHSSFGGGSSVKATTGAMADNTSNSSFDSSVNAENENGGYEALRPSWKAPSIAEAVSKLPSLENAPGTRAALVLTAGLMACEQLSGMTAILYYGGVFLTDIDVIPVDWGLAVLGVLQLVIAVIVMYTINSIGRKPLLLYGLAGLVISAAMLTMGSELGMNTGGRYWALIGLYCFTACYSLSLGALVWVLVSDVFPTCLRAQAISIVSITHFSCCAVMMVALPVMQTLGGYSCMFLCFLVVAIAANIFARRFMVETEGLSLVEIQKSLTKKAGFANPCDSRSVAV